MPKFQIKKFHQNMGHEGPGFACELHMDGKLLAHVYDEGNGGSPLYQWESREVADEFHAYLKTLPDKVYPADPECGIAKPLSVKADEETFINDLVEAHERDTEQKAMVRACKKKLLFRLKSDGRNIAYHTLDASYSASTANFVRQKYAADLLEIINETLETKSCPK
jgi:hypothetical protein